jgi:hypothetical protein
VNKREKKQKMKERKEQRGGNKNLTFEEAKERNILIKQGNYFRRNITIQLSRSS